MKGDERVQVDQLSMGLRRVTARYGFMENPSITDVLKRCREQESEKQSASQPLRLRVLHARAGSSLRSE